MQFNNLQIIIDLNSLEVYGKRGIIRGFAINASQTTLGRFFFFFFAISGGLTCKWELQRREKGANEAFNGAARQCSGRLKITRVVAQRRERSCWKSICQTNLAWLQTLNSAHSEGKKCALVAL